MKVLLVVQKNCKYSDKAYEFLKNFNCDLTLVHSSQRNEDLSSKIKNWEGDYLFSLFNYYIFPRDFLDKVKYPIKFHPSSPNHAGSGMINWALYNNDETFGSTAHLMNAEVDNGEILKVIRFKILNDDNIESLIVKSKKNCLNLFFEVIDQLLNKKITIKEMIQKSHSEKWLSKARKIKEIDEISKVDINISSLELEKRIKSFHTSKNPLTLFLHGKKFTYG